MNIFYRFAVLAVCVGVLGIVAVPANAIEECLPDPKLDCVVETIISDAETALSPGGEKSFEFFKVSTGIGLIPYLTSLNFPESKKRILPLINEKMDEKGLKSQEWAYFTLLFDMAIFHFNEGNNDLGEPFISQAYGLLRDVAYQRHQNEKATAAIKKLFSIDDLEQIGRFVDLVTLDFDRPYILGNVADDFNRQNHDRKKLDRLYELALAYALKIDDRLHREGAVADIARRLANNNRLAGALEAVTHLTIESLAAETMASSLFLASENTDSKIEPHIIAEAFSQVKNNLSRSGAESATFQLAMAAANSGDIALAEMIAGNLSSHRKQNILLAKIAEVAALRDSSYEISASGLFQSIGNDLKTGKPDGQKIATGSLASVCFGGSISKDLDKYLGEIVSDRQSIGKILPELNRTDVNALTDYLSEFRGVEAAFDILDLLESHHKKALAFEYMARRRLRAGDIVNAKHAIDRAFDATAESSNENPLSAAAIDGRLALVSSSIETGVREAAALISQKGYGHSAITLVDLISSSDSRQQVYLSILYNLGPTTQKQDFETILGTIGAAHADHLAFIQARYYLNIGEFKQAFELYDNELSAKQKMELARELIRHTIQYEKSGQKPAQKPNSKVKPTRATDVVTAGSRDQRPLRDRTLWPKIHDDLTECAPISRGIDALIAQIGM